MEKKKFFGEKIAFYRDQLKLNRKEFIELLNEKMGTKYSTQALYSWEKEKAMPPADLIPPLAKLLKVNLLEFYGIESPKENYGELEQINKELIKRVGELEQEVDRLKTENNKLEGKVEASNFFIKELMNKPTKE